MPRNKIELGMTEYENPLDLSDDKTRNVIIQELQQLQPGESQSYPIQTPVAQGDYGKIGYHVNIVGRLDGRKPGITLDLVEGEDGTYLYATCSLEADLR